MVILQSCNLQDAGFSTSTVAEPLQWPFPPLHSTRRWLLFMIPSILEPLLQPRLHLLTFLQWFQPYHINDNPQLLFFSFSCLQNQCHSGDLFTLPSSGTSLRCRFCSLWSTALYPDIEKIPPRPFHLSVAGLLSIICHFSHPQLTNNNCPSKAKISFKWYHTLFYHS